MIGGTAQLVLDRTHEHVAQQQRIAAAMTAHALGDLDLAGGLEVLLDHQALAAFARTGLVGGDRDGAGIHMCAAVLALGHHLGPLDHLELGPARGAVDRHPVALPGAVGVQGVGEHRAARVVHQRREVVLGGDPGREHGLVATVAVVLLGLEVERLEPLVGAQVQLEGIVGAVVRAPLRKRCQAALGGGVGPVEAQPAARVDLHRRIREPPVDQVEVVGGLVHEQAAAVGLVAVPAAEVVRAVLGVQHPLEHHRDHLADLAGRDDLLQRGVAGAVAVVEGHHHRAAGAIDRLLDRAGRGGVDGQRLLDHHVGPGVQGAHHVLGVEAVHAGDDHAVHRLLGDDLLELVRSSQPRPGESLVPALVVLATGGVHVDQGDQLGDVGVGAGDRVEEHLAAVTGADHGVTGGHVSPE